MAKLEAPVNRENICPSEKYGGDGMVMTFTLLKEKQTSMYISIYENKIYDLAPKNSG